MSVAEKTIGLSTFKTVDQPTVQGTPKTEVTDTVNLELTDIRDFLARPLELTNSSTGTFTFRPWDLIWSNSAIFAKIRNYKLIRGVMNLRLEVSVNPYIYGQVVMALSYNTDNSGGFINYDVTTLLQNDYSVILDAAVSQTVELSIPYFGQQPWMLVNNIPGTQNIQVDCYEINPMTDASSTGIPNVFYRVYGWVTELELAIATPQSDFVPDNVTHVKPSFAKSTHIDKVNRENNNHKKVHFNIPKAIGMEQHQGVISGAASVVTDIANKISDVPLIGGFAKTIAQGSSMVGSIAGLFGFSRPISLQQNERQIRTFAGSTAITSGQDVSRPLSTDINCFKNINPIDSNKEDLMSIAYTSRHWGYRKTCTIATTNNPGDSLCVIPVIPLTGTPTTGSAYTFSPLAFCTIPFARWRGSIEYKITIIASKFHKGRIKVFWTNSTSYGDDPTNTTTMAYMDIVPGNILVYNVPHSSTNPWYTTRPTEDGADVSTFLDDEINGYLNIVLDMPLTAPRTGANTYVRVEVRAGEDFMISCPTMDIMRYIVPITVTRSNMVPYQAVDSGTFTTLGPSYGGSLTLTQLGREDQNDYATSVAGERIVSFRDMAKRYSFFDNIMRYALLYTDNAEYFTSYRLRRMPSLLCRTDKTYGGSMTWLTYSTLPFRYESGSTRVKIVNNATMIPYNFSNVLNLQDNVYIMRGAYDGFSQFKPTITASGATYGDIFQRCAYTALQDFTAGGEVYNNSFPIEVQIPDMSHNRLNLVLPWLNPTTPDSAITYFELLNIPNAVLNGSDSVNGGTAQVFYAAGEDFNVSTFMGIPNLVLCQVYKSDPPG